MIIKTKVLDKSIKMPKLEYAKDGDAGIDLIATSKWYDEYGNVCFGTNRAFEIPKGYVGLIFPRSSNAKQQLLLSNSVGVIDYKKNNYLIHLLYCYFYYLCLYKYCKL